MGHSVTTCGNCDRNGCGNIICDYYSHTYGYICDECFSELLDKCDKISIGDFMYSVKCGSDDCWKHLSEEIVRNEFELR